MVHNSKSIMIVAGGEWQVPIIRKAKSLGYYVINSNLYEDSPGFQYSDIGLVADVLDKERNLEFARYYKPTAIITDQSDIAVPTVAYICEKIGRPGIGIHAAELFTNKHSMRVFCRENGFPVPNFSLCRNVGKITQFAEKYGYPFVIKPPSNQSSRGVHKINSKSEIPDKYASSLANSHDGSVLAEGFIEGPEFTVEGFKTNSRAYSLTVSKKAHYSHAKMVASNLFYSYSDPQYDYDELKALNEKLIEMMHLPFGITHAEYKFHNGKFYLIEIAARGGGTKISSHIIPAMSGVDVNELLIRCASGEFIDKIEITKMNNLAILDFFLFSPGIVKAINGLDWVSDNGSIIDFGFNFKIGDRLSLPVDDRARHGHYIAKAETESELRDLCKIIKNTVTLQYE